MFHVRDFDGPIESGWIPCTLDRDIKFSTTGLESYSCSSWDPVIEDGFVVAASVEFADMSCRRSHQGWARNLSLRVPVSNPGLWNSQAVISSLESALTCVTGDHWSISFYRRRRGLSKMSPGRLQMFPESKAVVAYSNGLDSLVAASIAEASLGKDIVRVRVGSPRSSNRRQSQPSVFVPFRVQMRRRRKEPTARSRGFKFALISGITAYLTGANKVIIPESGQGSIGPALVPLGHSYFDYRNHPEFTGKMADFFAALLGQQIHYEFPHIWSTKGESLRLFVSQSGSTDWQLTKSCWRSNRYSSVDGTWRHCGVCAACMLRRQSVHAAGLSEARSTYVCTDLNAPSLETAVDPKFKRLNGAYRKYAIAGTRHLADLANLANPEKRPSLQRHADFLGRLLPGRVDVEPFLTRLIEKHASEWAEFLNSLRAESFLRQWVWCIDGH